MPEDRLFVQSLQKGLALLEAFGKRPGELSLNELAALAGIDRSAAQRMAHTLLKLGYLERGAQGRGYTPGRRILDRSFDFLRSRPLIERATPLIIELQRSTGERVDFSLFDGQTIVYAVRRQSKRETFYATLAGRRLTSFSTAGGRACLAQLPRAEVEAMLARADLRPATPKTLLDPDAILARIEAARREGFALVQEEMLLGEVVVGAAVLERTGQPVAAVHIAGSLTEWPADRFAARFAPLALEAARALGGGRGLG
ncbi:IclR family transcriptional regulator C-terminal domain-containing protein [Roseomonas sp. E05]|uniref:IclR family transcriptional regulator n=1 Tax=Roseomonas sp. E05 TaxID=3046310 RepID=UPI0024B95DCD|nr:IclR family transcriptional regulator C-terminal domain-containing protein [Roseomonas sp. E05]MDJ0387308.1 IclR family transcriptional regulator C-terminal domain-containing protein [Roseomonas sp. E05]